MDSRTVLTFTAVKGQCASCNSLWSDADMDTINGDLKAGIYALDLSSFLMVRVLWGADPSAGILSITSNSFLRCICHHSRCYVAVKYLSIATATLPARQSPFTLCRPKVTP